MGLAGASDTDTDSELPLPPSHEKVRSAEGAGGARPPPGRVSGVDGGIGRGVVPRKSPGGAESDDEDDYVRQVARSAPRASSRLTTPARYGNNATSSSMNHSTAADAGSFMSSGDVESRLYGAGR